MEKKEMSFIEKFEAAGKELKKAMAESNNGAMIMIATSEGVGVSASIEGNSFELSTLLAYVACKCDGFKTILEKALMYAELEEQTNK